MYACGLEKAKHKAICDRLFFQGGRLSRVTSQTAQNTLKKAEQRPTPTNISSQCVFKAQISSTKPCHNHLALIQSKAWMQGRKGMRRSTVGKAVEVQDLLTAAVKCINLFNFERLLPGSQLVHPGAAPRISTELQQLTPAGDLAQFLNLS